MLFKYIDLAYLAGLLDGEGCIRIAHTSNNGKNHDFHLQVRIFNCYYPILNKYRKLLKLGEIYTRKGTNKDIHCWDLYSIKAEKMLRYVLPYLVIKKNQAKIAIKFQQYITKQKHRGRPLSLKEQKIRENYRFQLNELSIRNSGNNKKPIQYF